VGHGFFEEVAEIGLSLIDLLGVLGEQCLSNTPKENSTG
jgi:hypothetical protein